MNFSLT